MQQAFVDCWQTIDWAITAEATRDFTVSVASVVGVFIAIRGLNAWRKQLRGNTEYDLARRLMKAALKVREGIRTVRNPFMSNAEIDEAVRDQYPNDTAKNIPHFDSSTAVYNARWRAISDAMLDLKLELIEAEVIWGAGAKEQLEPLQKCVADLRIALSQHLQLRSKRPPPFEPDKVNEIDRIVFEVSDRPEKDDYTKRVHDAIENVQSFVTPHLKI
ncbi:hypothetical protein [Novipirellula sp.]|uniref:hypothetical protein n=1 Tax=Novipirellula sp. TaxID=2795430 RepID=UPI003568CEB4